MAAVILSVLLVPGTFALSSLIVDPSTNSSVDGSILLNATADDPTLNVTFSWLDRQGLVWNATVLNDTVNDTSFSILFDTSTLGNGHYNLSANATNGSIFVSNVSSDVYVNNAQGAHCGQLTSSYALTGNVSSPGTCFSINASDVVLDCNGHSITYANVSSGNGIVIAAGVSNVTITSCTIIQGTNASTAENPEHALILEGIDAQPIAQVTLSNLSIDTFGNHSSGISAAYASGLRLDGIDIDTRSRSATGIVFDQVNDSSIEQVNVTALGNLSNAIDFVSVTRTNLSDLSLEIEGDAADAIGLSWSSHIRISNLSANASGDTSQAIGVYDSPHIAIRDASLEALGASSSDMYLYGTSSNISIQDVTTTGTAEDIILDLASDSSMVYAVSSQLNLSKVTWYFKGTLNLGWYVDLDVNDTNGKQIAANVTYNDSGAFSDMNPSASGSMLVNASEQLILYGSSQNSSGIRTYYSNYTFTASSGNETLNASLNVSRDTAIAFTFQAPEPIPEDGGSDTGGDDDGDSSGGSSGGGGSDLGWEYDSTDDQPENTTEENVTSTDEEPVLNSSDPDSQSEGSNETSIEENVAGADLQGTRLETPRSGLDGHENPGAPRDGPSQLPIVLALAGFLAAFTAVFIRYRRQ